MKTMFPSEVRASPRFRDLGIRSLMKVTFDLEPLSAWGKAVLKGDPSVGNTPFSKEEQPEVLGLVAVVSYLQVFIAAYMTESESAMAIELLGPLIIGSNESPLNTNCGPSQIDAGESLRNIRKAISDFLPSSIISEPVASFVVSAIQKWDLVFLPSDSPWFQTLEQQFQERAPDVDVVQQSILKYLLSIAFCPRLSAHVVYSPFHPFPDSWNKFVATALVASEVTLRRHEFILHRVETSEPLAQVNSRENVLATLRSSLSSDDAITGVVICIHSVIQKPTEIVLSLFDLWYSNGISQDPAKATMFWKFILTWIYYHPADFGRKIQLQLDQFCEKQLADFPVAQTVKHQLSILTQRKSMGTELSRNRAQTLPDNIQERTELSVSSRATLSKSGSAPRLSGSEHKALVTSNSSPELKRKIAFRDSPEVVRRAATLRPPRRSKQDTMRRSSSESNDLLHRVQRYP